MNHTLNWLHTRTGKPMTIRGTWAQLWLRVMMVRTVHPGHPMAMDGMAI